MKVYDCTKLFSSKHNTQLGLPPFRDTHIISYHKGSYAQVYNYSGVLKTSPFLSFQISSSICNKTSRTIKKLLGYHQYILA